MRTLGIATSEKISPLTVLTLRDTAKFGGRKISVYPTRPGKEKKWKRFRFFPVMVSSPFF